MPEFNGDAIKRLRRGIEMSREQLKPFRENRYASLRNYVGVHYGNEVRRSGPLNMTFSAVSVMVPLLASQNPKARILTRKLDLMPSAYSMERDCNQRAEQMDLRATLRDLLFDAFFGIGIAKTGLAGGREVELEGELMDLGRFFCDRVDVEDWVYDPCANSWWEAEWMGNRFRMPYELAKEMYGPAADGLKASHPSEGAEDEAAKLTIKPHRLQELNDYVELYQIYMPRHGLVVTLSDSHMNPQSPLEVTEWNGPERGPYEMLAFHTVPNNLMPLAPVMVYTDLDNLINLMTGKLRRQAERQKTVGLFESVAEEDAERITSASDSEMIRCDNVDRIKEVTFGGADPNSFQFTQWLISMFSRMSGNLDLLGGLQAGANSATEAGLLQDNAKNRVEDMRNQFYHFTRHIMKRLAWYVFHDNIETAQISKEIEGIQLEIPATYGPDDKVGEWLDYELDIRPYSMSPDNPKDRAERMLTLMERVILPSAAFAAAQGDILKVGALVQWMGRELDLPELDAIYEPGLPLPMAPVQAPASNAAPRTRWVSGAAQGKSEGMQMPANNERVKGVAKTNVEAGKMKP